VSGIESIDARAFKKERNASTTTIKMLNDVNGRFVMIHITAIYTVAASRTPCSRIVE
jgi:hypothetical protein